MTTRTTLSLLLAAALGCASASVENRDEYRGEQLPRPGRILVHDFAVTAADLPIWAEYRQQLAATEPQRSPEELEQGRKLGVQVAEELVAKISAMGIPAARALGQPAPQRDDLVLVGAFTSLDPGSRAKRMTIGFGSGSAELRAHVAGYRMTENGLEKLGSGDADSGEQKGGPGMVVSGLVTVATANPVGLVVGTAAKGAAEATGASTIEGAAKRVAEKVAEVLQEKFEEQGWI